jgi:hypothetical protein
MKSPAIQYTDEQARLMTEEFIREYAHGGQGLKEDQATSSNGHIISESVVAQ